MPESPDAVWISKSEAARRLDCSLACVRGLVRDRYVAERRLPKGRPMVLAEDVRRVATGSIVAAVRR